MSRQPFVSEPDAKGRYGIFGGRYVPETLVPALDRLQSGVDRYLHSQDFQAELQRELKSWVGRPDRALVCAHALQALGRERLAQARGPGAHRRAQDQ